jgi:hypothetical protein
MTVEKLSGEQQTCGRGLAANAALATKLAELMMARAEVLERHTRALDPHEPAGQREIEAYAGLVGSHRDIAARLKSLATQMSSYRDLPMARHDMKAMTDPQGQAEAFERFQTIEREVGELLREK